MPSSMVSTPEKVKPGTTLTQMIEYRVEKGLYPG